jgi:hypothetical protein
VINWRLLIISTLLIQSSLSQLPSLPKQPWIGCFAVYDRSDFIVKIGVDGKILLEVKNDQHKLVGRSKSLVIEPVIEEMVPGMKQPRKIDRKSLVSLQKPTDKPTNIIFTGKVKGGAKFEISLDYEKDKVFVSGRLLDSDVISPYPLEFSIKVKFGRMYGSVKQENLAKVIQADKIELTDEVGIKTKYKVDKELNFRDSDFSKKIMNELKVDMKCFAKKRFIFSTEGGGEITLENLRGFPAAPMVGFFVVWKAQQDSSQKNQGRLVIEVK